MNHPSAHEGRASAKTTEVQEGFFTETIVVGFDGSEGAQRALRWAVEEARHRDARLRVVLAWEAPVQHLGGYWSVPDESKLEEYGRVAERRLDDALAPLAGELEGVDVERSAVHGAPAAVLLDAARDAAELVVGTRGHGGFAGLLLGSVGQQCAHHAPCPVVIVPGPR